MKKQTLVWIVLVVAVASLSSLVIFNKTSHAPSVIVVSSKGNEQKLADIQVTYTLSQSDQNLYNIKVTSSAQDGQAVLVSGKACNNMNSTITLLPKDTSTDKKVIKTLQDGRLVLEPVTMSTLMACLDSTSPQTDDQALNRVIDAIALSLKSY